MSISYVQLMKMTGNAHSLVLLLYLSTAEHTMDSLVSQSGFTETNICYHLKRFRDKGLIRGKRKHQQLYYSLIDETGEIRQFLFYIAMIFASRGQSIDSVDAPILRAAV